MAKIKPNEFSHEEKGADENGDFVLKHFLKTSACKCHPETCTHFSREVQELISFKTYKL